MSDIKCIKLNFLHYQVGFLIINRNFGLRPKFEVFSEHGTAAARPRPRLRFP